MGATDLLALSLGEKASDKYYFLSVISFAGLSLLAGLMVGKSIQCADKAGWFR